MLQAACAKKDGAGPIIPLFSPPPPPATVTVSIQADGGVNPDMRGRASPIVLRLYELKSGVAFERADFVSLFDRDQATLGAEFVGREEFVLRPGESREWKKTLGADVRLIGVVAAYRDLERSRWRASAAVQPNKPNPMQLRLEAAAAVLTPRP